MSANHRFPARHTAPEQFRSIAAKVLTAERVTTAQSFAPGRYKLRRDAIERLLVDQAVIAQTIKILRIEGGETLLHTLLIACGRLPERVASLDARSSSDKRQYLVRVQERLRALNRELAWDRPRACGAELNPDQWPPHPFFRESLLEDCFSALFRLGTFLEPVTGDEAWQQAKGHFPLSRLYRVLQLADKALNAKLAQLAPNDSVPQKGHGAHRGAIYIIDDVLSEFDLLFAAHPRRLSRNAIIAAFINASLAVPNDQQLDKNGNLLDQKYVDCVRRRRHSRAPEH